MGIVDGRSVGSREGLLDTGFRVGNDVDFEEGATEVEGAREGEYDGDFVGMIEGR